MLGAGPTRMPSDEGFHDAENQYGAIRSQILSPATLATKKGRRFSDDDDDDDDVDDEAKMRLQRQLSSSLIADAAAKALVDTKAFIDMDLFADVPSPMLNGCEF